MVRLKHLKLQNFRSFVDSEVSFPEKGLVLIQGSNDSGDSSGSGKSSLLLAIAYVLDILPPEFPATELQSWSTEAPMQVTLTLEVDGKEFVFSRGKKSYVKTPDRTITGSVAVMEAQAAVLGFKPDILQALTFRAQKTPGLFLSLAPANKVEFLTTVLGLEEIERAMVISELKMSTMTAVLSTKRELLIQRQYFLERTLSTPRPEVPVLEALNEQATANAAAQAEVLREIATLEEMTKRLSLDWEGTHESRLSELKTQIENAEELFSQACKKENRARSDHQEHVKNLHSQFLARKHAYQDAVRSINEVETNKGRLKHIDQSTCYVCGQVWLDSEKERLRLLDLIKEGETKAVTVDYWAAEMSKAEKAIAAAKFESDPNIAKLQEIRVKLASEEASLRSVLNPALIPITDELQKFLKRRHDLQVTEMEIKSKLKIAEVTRSNALKQIANLEKMRQEDELKVAELESEIVQIETMLNAERDFVSMIGREGFLGVIFSDVLREIADETNTRLSKLANVSNVRIGFQTESITQKGNARRQIGVVVTVGGHPARFKTGLSGGMQTSVEQQVDLAVISVISRRAGRTIGWLCLDEVFNGQGPATLETAMESLREFAEERLVLVIDHNSEMKEAFSKVIRIEHVNGVSSVL